MAIMSAAVRAFRNGDNAILESPTGTGKSLALLASSLAYQKALSESKSDMESVIDPPLPKRYLGFFPPKKYQKPGMHVFSDLLLGNLHPSHKMFYLPETEPTEEDIIAAQEEKIIIPHKRTIPAIWYATRTHQQLKQLVGELKKIDYHPQMAYMASRFHSCVWDVALDSGNPDDVCIESFKTKECPYKVLQKVPNIFRPHGAKEKYELSELVDYCKEKMLCPYFLARAMMKVADIVLCPYNYFLDPKVKGQMRLDLTGSYLIIDEAHNIENGCRENGSFSHTKEHYEWALKYLGRVIKRWKPSMIQNAFIFLKQHLSQIYHWLTNISEQLRSGKEDRYIADDTATVLDEWGLTPYTWPRLEASFDCILKIANGSNTPEFIREMRPEMVAMPLWEIIEQLWVMLALVFKEPGMKAANDYKIYVKLGKIEGEDTLHGLVMNPGIVFDRPATEAHSVVLTSGTLSPLSTFGEELRKPFPILLSAPHVIDQSQVLGYTVSMLPNGSRMRSTAAFLKDNREDVNLGLGSMMLQFLPLIPGGVLLFVPSHEFLQKLVETWKRKCIYDMIESIKPIFCESREPTEGFFENYKEAVYREGGSLLVGVFRGRASEGVDFLDEQARAVFAFGIPFPSVGEPEVFLKRQYNEAIKKGSGDEWYEAQAFRSLFQAIGRCIRHRNDYGAIFLIDDRFEKELHRFPRWMSPSIRVGMNFQVIKRELQLFYKEMEDRFPPGAPIIVGSSLTLFCSQCRNPLLQIPKVPNSELTSMNNKSFSSLTNSTPASKVYPIDADVNLRLLIPSDNTYEKDRQYVFQRLSCTCSNCFGAVIVANAGNPTDIGGMWILIDRVRMGKGSKFVCINGIREERTIAEVDKKEITISYQSLPASKDEHSSPRKIEKEIIEIEPSFAERYFEAQRQEKHQMSFTDQLRDMSKRRLPSAKPDQLRNIANTIESMNYTPKQKKAMQYESHNRIQMRAKEVGFTVGQLPEIDVKSIPKDEPSIAMNEKAPKVPRQSNIKFPSRAPEESKEKEYIYIE